MWPQARSWGAGPFPSTFLAVLRCEQEGGGQSPSSARAAQRPPSGSQREGVCVPHRVAVATVLCTPSPGTAVVLGVSGSVVFAVFVGETSVGTPSPPSC